MRYLLYFLLATAAAAQSLSLDVFDGDNFTEIDVPLGANSLLGFDTAGQPARVTSGSGITISGGVISATGTGGSPTLSGLTDVTLSSAAEGQLLRYNGTSGKWQNWTPVFAPLESPTFTGVVTIPSGAEIADYVRQASPYILGTLTWEHPNTELGTQTSALDIAPEQVGLAWTMPSEAGRLLTNNSQLIGGMIVGNISPTVLGTGTGISTKFLRGDSSWQSVGDALTSGTLAQFAATTSAQLRAVLTDESGTGAILTTNGSAANLTSFPTLNQSTTGNAATASALQTARTINGVAFDGSANITVTAAAGTLTGTALAANVVSSSLASVGTITAGTWQGSVIAPAYLGTGTGIATKFLRGDGVWSDVAGLPAGIVVTGSDVSSVAIVRNALGTTPTTGFSLTNSTPAAAGAQQASPRAVMTGQGWKTAATAASQAVSFGFSVLPVQGAAAPTGVFNIEVDFNGAGTWPDVLSIASDGLLSLPNGAGGAMTQFGSVSSGIVRLAPLGTTAQIGTLTSPVITGFLYTGSFGTGGSFSSDGAGNISMRGFYDPTLAQSLHIHRTYTSSTNFERLFVGATGTTFEIKPVKGGAGGVARPVKYYVGESVWFGSGSGSPEGVEAAGVGSVYTDNATGALYRKTTGTGTNGWVTP